LCACLVFAIFILGDLIFKIRWLRHIQQKWKRCLFIVVRFTWESQQGFSIPVAWLLCYFEKKREKETNNSVGHMHGGLLILSESKFHGLSYMHEPVCVSTKGSCTIQQPRPSQASLLSLAPIWSHQNEIIKACMAYTIIIRAAINLKPLCNCNEPN